MRDLDIRLALHQGLKTQHMGEPDTLILDELGLCQGVSRVDIAVINGAITGYEIKSERDTLSRLPGQVEIYNKTLDQVTIVASGPHVEAVAKFVPEWWGLQEAVQDGDSVLIQTHREPADNPGVDPYALAQLLWRDEALTALREIGLDKGMLSKPRQALWAALATTLAVHELKALVRSQLKARANWRSAETRA